MPGHDIIVIGASAGGVEALLELVALLPAGLPAALFIVVHFPAQGKSILPDILNREGHLHAAPAQDNEVIKHGGIYIAPPDYHLLVKRGYISLVQGPKENGTRPAVDPLFRTAAKAYSSRVVGVVLSGMLDDGTAGLIDVKRSGGVAVVQSPDEALFPGMPKSAIEHVDVDHILPVSEIASILVHLAHKPVVERDLTVSGQSKIEPDIVELDGVGLRNQGYPGTPSGFMCPDCGGGLFELHERKLLQYRRRVGHAFSAATLLVEQATSQEEALWAAIRSLEERADLLHKMASRARSGNHNLSAERFEAQAKLTLERSDLLQQVLFQGQLPAMATPATYG